MGIFLCNFEDLGLAKYTYLRIICDEILGKNNNLAQFAWRTDGNFDNQARVKMCHEYILCYLKRPDILGLPKGIDQSVSDSSKLYRPEIRNTLVKNGIKNPMSEVVLPAGFPCAIETMYIKERYDSFPYYLSDAVIKNFRLENEVTVKSGWSSKKILSSFINNNCNEVLDSKGQLTSFEISATGAIEMIKKRNNTSHVISMLSGLGSTQNMSNELKKMNISFDFPKPTALLEYIFGFYCDKDSVILDSFAGSGTTAHAVLNMNKADGGNRKFILVEMEDYADTITAERVKRVIDGYADIKGTGGNFSFYDLGEPLLLNNQYINENIGEDKIREYVYFMAHVSKIGK